MNYIRKLHEEAMDLAEMAFIARRKGDLEQANRLFRQAYENEAQVVKLMLDEHSPEPTRSVLYRSAASLALQCNELREAERLIAAGLAGNPPEEIAEELRELYVDLLDSLEPAVVQTSGIKKEPFFAERSSVVDHYKSTISDGRGNTVIGMGATAEEAAFRAIEKWKEKKEK